VVKRKQSTEEYRNWALRNPEKVAAKQARRYARIRASREAIVSRAVATLLANGFSLIPSYPRYLISRNGEIYSTLFRRIIKMRPGIKPAGYEFVCLRNGNGAVYEMVHRLVAITYIPNPFGFPHVNHLDGDKSNNSDTNLEWCTHAQNMWHAVFTGLNRGRIKVKA
jgi:hypothetical protein